MRSERLCPSAPASAGAVVIGVVAADGSTSYIRDRLVATSEFLEAAAGPSAEARFRFGSVCQESACRQWVDGRCQVPEVFLDEVPDAALAEELPRCSIRAQCRWFSQRGPAACRICPLVQRRPAADAAPRSAPEDHPHREEVGDVGKQSK